MSNQTFQTSTANQTLLLSEHARHSLKTGLTSLPKTLCPDSTLAQRRPGQIHDFANVTLAMSDGFDRVVPSPSWGLLCFALPGNFNVYLERIEVQREKLALSFDLQRQNLFFETNGRERSLCSLGLRQRSTQEKQVSKRRLKYFSLTE